MDGVQLSQGYRATTRRHLLFATKLASILSFPKRLLPTIFNSHGLIANCDVMFYAIWYHLYNLKNVNNTHGRTYFW